MTAKLGRSSRPMSSRHGLHRQVAWSGDCQQQQALPTVDDDESLIGDNPAPATVTGTEQHPPPTANVRNVEEHPEDDFEMDDVTSSAVTMSNDFCREKQVDEMVSYTAKNRRSVFFAIEPYEDVTPTESQGDAEMRDVSFCFSDPDKVEQSWLDGCVGGLSPGKPGFDSR